MMDIKTDLVIVGGGIAGLATANRAAELGCRVVVLEKGEDERYPCNSRVATGALNVAHTDPYSDPAAHVCEPVSPSQLGVTAQGLVWSATLKQYIAVDAGTGKDPQGDIVDGVFYSTSPDLIHWSPRQLLWQQQVFNNWQQGDPNPIGYASLIDPTSHSRNFETVGRTVESQDGDVQDKADLLSNL